MGIPWLDKLQISYASEAAHTFLLYLNTDDPVVWQDQAFVELPNFLPLVAPLKNSYFVAIFNRAEGIRFLNQDMEAQFLNFLGQLYPQRSLAGQQEPDAVLRFRKTRYDIGYMFYLFSEMLQVGWNDERPREAAILRNCFGEKVETGKTYKLPFFSVVLEYIESLAPPDSLQSAMLSDRDALVTMLTWAKNSNIAKAKNAIFLLGVSLGAIARELSSDAKAIIPIEVPFVGFKDRIETLELLQKDGITGPDWLDTETTARLSSGLSRRNLMQLAKECAYKRARLDEDVIFEGKKKQLDERSEGLAEIYKPIWGIEAIGGLEDKKEYIKDVVAAMKRGDVLAVPQGILLFGPPGTGKTVFVQALAYEAGLEVIKLKNLRSMWVGQSERNQDYMLKLAISHQPIIIFFDEVDQEFLMRGTFFSGDTGVTQRMQGRFLEMMSDTDLRGKVLSIGASNRPDLIDQAFLREGRFDDVLPFLPCNDPRERVKILKAILHKLGRQAEKVERTFQYEIGAAFEDEFGRLTHGHYREGEGWIPCSEDTHKDKKTEYGFTGGEIEYIIVLANRRATKNNHPLGEEDLQREIRDFIPKRNMIEFEAAIDIALRHCNSLSFIPEEWQERARRVRGQKWEKSKTSTNLSGPGQYL